MNDTMSLNGNINRENRFFCTVGLRGPKGEKGDAGLQGAQGEAASVTIGAVVTGEPGTGASVTNRGDAKDAVLDFVIPRGDSGELTENDLRAAMDAEKQRVRRQYAGRLRGAASHESLVSLADCAGYSDFSGITICGRTAESGSGEKSPDNPYLLSGEQPAKITVNQDEYPIALTEPLFGLGDIKDSFNAVSGEEKRPLMRTVFTGGETWHKYTLNTKYNVYYTTVHGVALGYQTSVCSHFKNVDETWTENGFFGEYSDHKNNPGQKYFNLGPMYPTIEDFKAWLYQEYTAGRPVTLVSMCAVLREIQHAPADIPQPWLLAAIGAEGAPMLVEYSRDITTALENLTGAAGALGGTFDC